MKMDWVGLWYTEKIMVCHFHRDFEVWNYSVAGTYKKQSHHPFMNLGYFSKVYNFMRQNSLMLLFALIQQTDYYVEKEEGAKNFLISNFFHRSPKKRDPCFVCSIVFQLKNEDLKLFFSFSNIKTSYISSFTTHN